MKISAQPPFFITLITLFLTNEPKYVMFMLFSAFVHEVGHIVAFGLCSVRVERLVLGLFGGTLILEKKLISYPKEAFTASAGALANLLCSLVCFAVLRSGFSFDMFFLFSANLFYAVFNILPISGLDGGAVLLSLMSIKKELGEAERTAGIISRITLFLLAVCSLLLVSVSAFNLSLFVITLMLYAESSVGHIISGYEFCRKTS